MLTRWGLSDAAGRYQIMVAISEVIRTDTWDCASRACKVFDFTPASQDKVAAYLITRRGALPDLLAGRFASPVEKRRKEWPACPGG